MTFEETKNNYLKGHSTWPYLDDDAALMFYRAGQEEMRESALAVLLDDPIVFTHLVDRIRALPLAGDDEQKGDEHEG